jgi:ComF family protein
MKLAAMTLQLGRDAALGAMSLVYPPSCEACGAGVEHGQYLCGLCAARAARINPPYCEVCSEPFHGAITGTFTCQNCVGRNFHFTCAVAPYRSTGVVRDFIHRFKYFREFHLRHPLAHWAAEALQDERMIELQVDALVPVPLFRARERDREFNQATELARLIAARSGIPMRDCLKRIRNTTSQLTYDRGGRMENLRNAFKMRQNADVRGLHLVLVDDVLTTGSTLDECARVLLSGGAASVRAITVARG